MPRLRASGGDFDCDHRGARPSTQDGAASLWDDMIMTTERVSPAGCLLCFQLRKAIESAEQAVPPDINFGTNKASKRNLLQQHKEAITRAELALEKHYKAHENATPGRCT